MRLPYGRIFLDTFSTLLHLRKRANDNLVETPERESV
jgi:hypothetical protein